MLSSMSIHSVIDIQIDFIYFEPARCNFVASSRKVLYFHILQCVCSIVSVCVCASMCVWLLFKSLNPDLLKVMVIILKPPSQPSLFNLIFNIISTVFTAYFPYNYVIPQVLRNTFLLIDLHETQQLPQRCLYQKNHVVCSYAVCQNQKSFLLDK